MSLETEFHSELSREALRWLVQRSTHVLVNARMIDGHIPDLIAIDAKGEITIIEVKTRFLWSLAGAAMSKYCSLCNYLYVAAPESDITAQLAVDPEATWYLMPGGLGLIGLGRGGTRRMRAPLRRAIPVQRHRDLTKLLQETGVPCLSGEAVAAAGVRASGA